MATAPAPLKLNGTGGPARGGLLDWLRARWPWAGPKREKATAAGDALKTERVKSGPGEIRLPWFLPYFDPNQSQHETQSQRLAYRLMLADPNVKAALLGKVLDVAALELKVIPAKKKNKTLSRKQRAYYDTHAEFCRYALEERLHGGLPELAWNVLVHACVDGYSVCEKVWAPEDKGEWVDHAVLDKVKVKDTGHDVVPVTDEYRNVTSIRALRYNAGEEFAPAHFLLYRHLPMWDQPTGLSDFRAVYSRWWMLDTALKLRARFVERKAVGFLVGTFTDPAQQHPLESVLARVKGDNWAAVPDSVKIELLNLAQGGEDVFKSYCTDQKHDIFLGIQGAILQSIEGQLEDARGNTQVHRSTADKFVWWLSITLQGLLNQRNGGLLCDLVDLNYAADAYPRLVIGNADLDEMLRELQIDTGLAALGLALDRDEMYERYGRQPPENPANALQPPGPPPGLPPAGGGGGGGISFTGPRGGNWLRDPASGKLRHAPAPSFDEPDADVSIFTRRPRRFAEGRWVTIGGQEGDDGKRHGGSPVYIEDGRITKGHPSLTGEHVASIGKGEVEHGSHRKQLARSRDYEVARYVKAARKEGIHPDDLHGLAQDIHAHDRAFKGERQAVLDRAKELFKHYGYHAGALTTNLRSGRVEDEVPGLDVVADSLARSYPEHFAHGDPAETLLDYFRHGSPEPMTKAEAYEAALEHLRQGHGARRHEVSEEPIPFVEDAAGHEHRGQGEGGPA